MFVVLVESDFNTVKPSILLLGFLPGAENGLILPPILLANLNNNNNYV